MRRRCLATWACPLRSKKWILPIYFGAKTHDLKNGSAQGYGKGDRPLKCVQECDGHDLECWTMGLLEPEVWIGSCQLHEVHGGEEPRLDVVSDDGGSIFLGGEPLLGIYSSTE